MHRFLQFTLVVVLCGQVFSAYLAQQTAAANSRAIDLRIAADKIVMQAASLCIQSR